MSNVANHGVTLSLSDMAGTPTFNAIGQIVEITPPNISRGVTPVPDHDDSGGIPFYADALYDGGEVTFTVKHDPALSTHDATDGIRAAMIDGNTRDWRIVLPDTGSTQYDFAGFVVAWNPAAMPVNEGVKMLSVTIKVDGDITDS